MAIKQQRRLCQILGGADFVTAGRVRLRICSAENGCGEDGGGGRVEVFLCRGKGERNGRQQDDHW